MSMPPDLNVDVIPSTEPTEIPVEFENSNQSVEIPHPPPVKPVPTTDSSSWESDSSSDGDESDNDFPIDLTFDWLEERMKAGVDLRPLLARVLPGLPSDVTQSTIYELLMDLFLPFRQRKALERFKTFDDAVELIRTSKKILVLTGAGLSVSCGIPDFRSRNGIYARLRDEFPELPNPQSMFDIKYFTSDPRPFFRFAKEIWPGQYEPSLGHYFIAELERRDQLLRNYTQNIDSLEHLCPITRLIQCHGSFSTATCRRCNHKVRSDEIKDEILQQKIPHCTKCPSEESDAILKPDIVFFGEQLSDEFHQTISDDKEKCDLLIVIGSSLKVKPVSLVSELLPEHVPQILINRERLPHKTFDIELLGNCDLIINELCHRLAALDPSFKEIKHFKSHHQLNEILYDTLRTSVHKQKKKKQKVSHNPQSTEESSQPRLSSLRPRSSKNTKNSGSSSSSSSCSSPIPGKRRAFSSLQASSSSFNSDLSYISYPPRRYIFAGAEVYFSSDDDSSDDDEHHDLSRK